MPLRSIWLQVWCWLGLQQRDAPVERKYQERIRFAFSLALIPLVVQPPLIDAWYWPQMTTFGKVKTISEYLMHCPTVLIVAWFLRLRDLTLGRQVLHAFFFHVFCIVPLYSAVWDLYEHKPVIFVLSRRVVTTLGLASLQAVGLGEVPWKALFLCLPGASIYVIGVFVTYILDAESVNFTLSGEGMLYLTRSSVDCKHVLNMLTGFMCVVLSWCLRSKSGPSTVTSLGVVPTMCGKKCMTQVRDVSWHGDDAITLEGVEEGDGAVADEGVDEAIHPETTCSIDEQASDLASIASSSDLASMGSLGSGQDSYAAIEDSMTEIDFSFGFSDIFGGAAIAKSTCEFQGWWELKPDENVVKPEAWLQCFGIVGRFCMLGDGAETYLKVRDADEAVVLEGGVLSIEDLPTRLVRTGKSGNSLEFLPIRVPELDAADLLLAEGDWHIGPPGSGVLSIVGRKWRLHGQHGQDKHGFLKRSVPDGPLMMTQLNYTLRPQDRVVLWLCDGNVHLRCHRIK